MNSINPSISRIHLLQKEDIKEALHGLIKREDRLHIYTHLVQTTLLLFLILLDLWWPRVIVGIFSLIISLWQFLVLEDDERKALDYLSTRLTMMVKELNFGLILVSHVNDQGQTRGSRNISKIADCWIHLERDKQSSIGRTKKHYLSYI